MHRERGSLRRNVNTPRDGSGFNGSTNVRDLFGLQLAVR